MRKGSERRDWTVSEEAYLQASAGRVPVREICRHLKRSRMAVYQKAKALRRRGKAVDLRIYRSDAFLCPSCGCARTLGRASGICEACKYRRLEAEAQARIAELWPLLPQSERDRYEAEDAKVGARIIDAPPRAPRLPRDASLYRRRKAEGEWERAVEQTETANAKRAYKAAQKRKERIEKKVKSMTNREYTQIGGS